MNIITFDPFRRLFGGIPLRDEATLNRETIKEWGPKSERKLALGFKTHRNLIRGRWQRSTLFVGPTGP